MRRLVHDSKTHTVLCLPLPCPAPPGPPGFTPEMAHLGRPPALLCLLPATLQPEAQPETPFPSRQRRKPEASAQPSCQECWIIHDMATPFGTFYLVRVPIHWCQSVLPALTQLLFFFLAGLLTHSYMYMPFLTYTDGERNA